jgi:hypothetical protein
MARKVYFAFHYQKDIVRVNQVRNSDITKEDRELAGFYDAGLWEKSKKSGDEAIRRMIKDGLDGTTVTVFLLGEETAKRPWVKYELEESWKRGNGLVSIYINDLLDFERKTTLRGSDILDDYTYTLNGVKYKLSTWFKTYDWKGDNGYENFGEWVEETAQIAEDLKNKGIM